MTRRPALPSIRGGFEVRPRLPESGPDPIRYKLTSRAESLALTGQPDHIRSSFAVGLKHLPIWHGSARRRSEGPSSGTTAAGNGRRQR